MVTTSVPDPGNPGPQLPPLLRQAVVAHRGGRFNDADPLYQEFLSKNPDHPTALQLYGLLHSQRGDYETAISYMARSLRLFRQQPEVYNNMGNALAACGRLEEAEKSYSQAIGFKPDYLDAWRNLGLCMLDLERYQDAETSLKRCIELDGRDAVAWLSLGLVYNHMDRLDEAIKCLETALSLRPDYAEAHHNLGVCLQRRQQADEAIRHFEAAQRLGLDRAELYQNLGTAQLDLEQVEAAIDAYRKAVERDPGDLTSHRNLNALLWEYEYLDDYLKSYRNAVIQRPENVQLRADYATALNRQEKFEEAEKVLMEGLRRLPGTSEFKSLLAYTLERQERWNDALLMHEATVAMPDANPNHSISLARALLACQRPEQAMAHADDAVRRMPGNQLALAYQGLCWRMLGDERDERLNDYGSFVKVYDVPVPPGFANAEEFNDVLIQVLNSLHTGKRHPAEQTLRGGTQTHGKLFDRSISEIAELVTGLRQCILDYIGRMEPDPAHPLLSRRATQFAFSGSWSARLRPCGYHTMHVHPMGWISSAYYVQVPPEVSQSDAHGGGIKFGEPDIDLGDRGVARRAIQPVAGQLVLFPSYMWHGTVPHQTEGDRMTVAFDVVPGVQQRG